MSTDSQGQSTETVVGDPMPVTMSSDEKHNQRSSNESSHISADNAEKGTPASNNTAPVAPDGGTTAWLVVLGAWCTAFCSFGWLNSTFSIATVIGFVQVFLRYYRYRRVPTILPKDTASSSLSKYHLMDSISANIFHFGHGMSTYMKSYTVALLTPTGSLCWHIV